MIAKLSGFFLLASLASGPAQAQADPVLLTVSGEISHYTDPARKLYQFRESELQALPQHTNVTATTWTLRSAFSGPLMRDILQKVGARGPRVKFRALNDYAYTLDAAELRQYPVILARSQNGKKMDIANRGPLWLMYPLEDMPPNLRGPLLDAKLVWQVDRIEIQ
ncbi:oxidoreductase [Chromobacterium sp. ATCC 53434]|uniref:molybdopterin-dependent oxidoreductase n=1 Tax=Chromobacterium TaxID=535 RepID=UPI000C7666FF|nr:molybdopterin-dependent oxidoreductase [Chromobacterium sp. ATCC 53434]AUH53022.1 oxidoreductase [Chromobacterium sp. ATCC 53434]